LISVIKISKANLIGGFTIENLNAFRDLLEKLEGQIDFKEHNDKFRQFMLECCRLIEHRFFPKAKIWLELAKNYEKGLVSNESLNKALVEAWNLEKYYRKSDYLNYASTRAIICLLDLSDKSDYWFMSLDLFVDWCNFVENHQEEQIEIFRRIFLII